MYSSSAGTFLPSWRIKGIVDTVDVEATSRPSAETSAGKIRWIAKLEGWEFADSLSILAMHKTGAGFSRATGEESDSPQSISCLISRNHQNDVIQTIAGWLREKKPKRSGFSRVVTSHWLVILICLTQSPFSDTPVQILDLLTGCFLLRFFTARVPLLMNFQQYLFVQTQVHVQGYPSRIFETLWYIF